MPDEKHLLLAHSRSDKMIVASKLVRADGAADLIAFRQMLLFTLCLRIARRDLLGKRWLFDLVLRIVSPGSSKRAAKLMILVVADKTRAVASTSRSVHTRMRNRIVRGTACYRNCSIA